MLTADRYKRKVVTVQRAKSGATWRDDRRWDCPDCETARICASRPECPLCGQRMIPHRAAEKGE